MHHTNCVRMIMTARHRPCQLIEVVGRCIEQAARLGSRLCGARDKLVDTLLECLIRDWHRHVSNMLGLDVLDDVAVGLLLQHCLSRRGGEKGEEIPGPNGSIKRRGTNDVFSNRHARHFWTYICRSSHCAGTRN